MIRIALPAQPEEDVAFAVSPLHECVLSLHVLLGPKHHALQHAWVRKMRTLDPELRREIEALDFVYRRQIPDCFLPTADDQPEPFERELERFRALPPDLLVPALARPLSDHGGTGVVDRDAVEAGGGGELLADPSAFADRLARMFERYWEAGFGEEWERRVEPVLDAAIVEAGRLVAAEGIPAVLGRLPAHCRFDRDGNELLVDVPHDHAVRVDAGNPLVLCPSVFAWPHLLVNCDPPWPTAVVYAAPALARDAEPRMPPEDLLRSLEAIADDSRLRILRLIAERPRTTQELAPLVGLSRAGLSKSLHRLVDAGLLTGRREGYYVVYSLAPERLRSVATELDRFLAL